MLFWEAELGFSTGTREGPAERLPSTEDQAIGRAGNRRLNGGS